LGKNFVFLDENFGKKTIENVKLNQGIAESKKSKDTYGCKAKLKHFYIAI